MTVKLVCPLSRSPLHAMPAGEAEEQLGGALQAGRGVGFRPVGATPTVMIRRDRGGAYPVVDGVPVLLGPELLTAANGRHVDVTQPRYAEAYREMEHYSRAAAQDAESLANSNQARNLEPVLELDDARRAAFPYPYRVWLDARYELHAQATAFGHLRPVAGGRVMQIGGRGLQAVKFLLAGAREATVVSPMVGELQFAAALAAMARVGNRLRCVAAVAEELPFADGQFDAVYSQGCVHHWVTPLALPECARVLVPGGRFAAVEPWRAPLYGVGTAVLGKRDRDVHCIVLTADRVLPHLRDFSHADVVHHGALSRYPLLALRKAGIKLSRHLVWRIGELDDAICDRVVQLRAAGSSVAVLGTRGA